ARRRPGQGGRGAEKSHRESDVVKTDLDSESDRNRLVALVRRFEAPLPDGLDSALVDVLIDRPDDVDINRETVRADDEADQDDAANAKPIRAGIGFRAYLMDDFGRDDAVADIENRLVLFVRVAFGGLMVLSLGAENFGYHQRRH